MPLGHVTMDYTLTHLIDSLQSTLKILKDEANAQLLADLHDHNKLPRKKLVGLASQAIDLLNETEQLLEPGSLVLADHFLGRVLPQVHHGRLLTTAF